MTRASSTRESRLEKDLRTATRLLGLHAPKGRLRIYPELPLDREPRHCRFPNIPVEYPPLDPKSNAEMLAQAEEYRKNASKQSRDPEYKLRTLTAYKTKPST